MMINLRLLSKTLLWCKKKKNKTCTTFDKVFKFLALFVLQFFNTRNFEREILAANDLVLDTTNSLIR